MLDYTDIEYDFELLQGEVTTKFVEEAVVAKVAFFVLALGGFVLGQPFRDYFLHGVLNSRGGVEVAGTNTELDQGGKRAHP